MSLNRNNQSSQPPVPSADAQQSQLQSIMMGQLLESNRVLQQQLQTLTNRMDQYQNDAASSADAILPAFPGIEPNEIRELTEADGEDQSDFYFRHEAQQDIEYIDDKQARKELKAYTNVLTDPNKVVEWLKDFDYRCDNWGIHPRMRFKACATGLLGTELMEQLRIERETGQAIDSYASLKRWLYKAVNGRARVLAAQKKIMKWKPTGYEDAASEFRQFMSTISKYKAELYFAMDWGMNKHEINIIPEEQLFDVFLDRASQHDILRETFQQKVNGRRSIRKARHLSKYISYIQRDRTTQSQRRKKKKSKKRSESTIMAIQSEQRPRFTPRPKGYFGPWCGTHKSKSHSWSKCSKNPNNNGRKPQRKSNRPYRFKTKPKQAHIPGENCEMFGHTAATCWGLHPELRPAGKRQARIFAMQRKVNEATQQLHEAIGDWNVAQSSSSSSEAETTIENSADELKTEQRLTRNDDSEDEDEEDEDSTSASDSSTRRFTKFPRKQ